MWDHGAVKGIKRTHIGSYEVSTRTLHKNYRGYVGVILAQWYPNITPVIPGLYRDNGKRKWIQWAIGFIGIAEHKCPLGVEVRLRGFHPSSTSRPCDFGRVYGEVVVAATMRAVYVGVDQGMQ